MTGSILPRVRFTWNISYDCNYRCSYCFFDGKWEEYKKRNIYLSCDEWMKHWGRVAEKYGEPYLVITGGEPFIYPNFIELIGKLSRICFHINISTNSSVNLKRFVEVIDPEKVSISLSFQREFDTLDNYIQRVKLIRGNEFKGCLNLVAYPPYLKKIDYDKKKLMDETGEKFKVIPFFGKYREIDYPQGYTAEERKLIGIDDDWYSRVHRKGNLCSAGHTSALVFPEGKVARCGQIGERLLIGNFLDPDFMLYDKATVCDAEYCPCQEDSIGDKEDNVVAQKQDTVLNNNPDLSIDKEVVQLGSTNVSVNYFPKVKESGLPAIESNPASHNGRIKFAWDIHYKCNFRCPYCWFYKDWARLGSRSLYLGVDEWFNHWKNIYDKYGEVKIEIVGGEPFIYPNFIELIKKLSSLHLIKITTNLSGDIERFVQEITPDRVELDLNFHVLFIDLETVIRKALILKTAGFNAGICYLAYPPQMHKIKYLSDRFQKEGINFALAAFWGEYNGKKYPDGYTQEEKELMRPFLGDISRVTYHLDAKSPKGKLCKAGYKYADIQADGNVVRCSPLAHKSIGNIFDKDFRLFSEPLPCESDSCSSNEYINIVDEATDRTGQTSTAFQQIETKDDAPIRLGSPGKETIFSTLANVKFPRLHPPYRVHWNWELGLSCNYKCSYCNVWPKSKGEKYAPIDLKSWRDIWDRMFEKYWCCHVRFSGGEPTIYPGFFDIVSLLLEKHTVDITTNLSFDVMSFSKKVKAGGLSISTSFHPEYNKIGPFLDKVLFLHQNGYPSTISYVAYPPHLDEIQAAKALVERNKILFKIIPYQGEFQGKKYPEAYTPNEKMLIEGLISNSADTHLNELNERWYDWNVKRDKVVKTKKGELCRMGQMYAKIFPDGRVARCCAMDKDSLPMGIMGHITDPDLRLLDEPMPCEADNCPCFKSMLVNCEEEKWLPLWEALEHPIYKTDEAKRFAQEKTQQISQTKIILQGDEKKNGPENVPTTTFDRKLINPYRVFYTWDIHYACNYRCAYCFFAKKWYEMAKENKYPGLDTWKRIWKNIYARYGSGHIHVSGGEPFTYPSFIDLVSYLIKDFTIEFDTNLSFDVDDFISKINPGRVKFATAFHPTFVSFEQYRDKVLKLKDAGFDMGINYVAHPPQLKKMKEYKNEFEKHNITFTIMPFRGVYENRTYPQGYSEAEKEFIRQSDSNLAISTKMIDWYGKDKLARKEAVCRMGQMYTKIHPNGDAFRCCFINDKGRLGNLIDGTFALWDEPKLCEYPECPCWTAMVIGQDEHWTSHWVIPKQDGIK